MDWGVGGYEQIAAELAPAAAVVVDQAALRAGEDVLDVGCGTGNAALLAAERGARTTGIDPAVRLLELARARAADAGLEVSFVPGEAAALPVPDACADAVLSVFAVIFAPDAGAAAAEMARALRPGGRIVLSAWLPEGPIFEIGRLRREAMAAAAAPPAPSPFAWHEPEYLNRLFGPYGLSFAVSRRVISFEGQSAESFIDFQIEHHPGWAASRDLLAAQLDRLRQEAVQILKQANQNPDGFRITSRYVVAEAWSGA